MARHIFQSHFKDGNGNVVSNGVINVYRADTGGVATVYLAATGSVATSITSNSSGYFAFYVDEADYNINQLFNIKLSKAGMTDQWYYNVPIIKEYNKYLAEHNSDGTHSKLTKVTDPWIDVRAFDSIQMAINSVSNAGTGRVYKFTTPGYQGVSTITAPLVFTGANFRLEGMRGRDTNWTGATIKASGSLACILDMATNPCDFFDVVRVRLHGNGTAVDGIRLGLTSGHASNLLIEDVTIQNVTGTAINTDAGPGGPMADSSIVRPIIETVGTGIAIAGQVVRVYAGTIAGCSTAGTTFAASSSASFYGTVFSGNAIDIKYIGNDTINSLYFNGCWFENATDSILKRPDVPSITKACGALTFVGCNFHALSSANSLLDFTNIEGTHYIIGGHWDSAGKGNVIVPANCTLYIDADFANQLTYSGAGRVVFGPSVTQVQSRAYRGTSNQSVNASAWTKVQLNAESWDYGSKFDSTTNYRYQPGIAGLYCVKASVQFANTEVGKQYYASLYVDGVLVSAKRLISPLTGSILDVDIADNVVLTASSYLELYCYHDSAAAKDVVFDANGSTTHLSAYRIG